MNKKIPYRLITILFIILFLFIFVLLTKDKIEIVNLNNKVEKLERYSKGECILFLGDSITARYDLDKYFPNYYTVNSGVGGNIANDILNDMDNRVYKYNPTKVFILLGTNDIIYSGLEYEGIKDKINELISDIHEKFPNAKIYLESIYPINNIDEKIVDGRKNDNIKVLNSMIKTICDDNKCEYIDLYDDLTDKNGNLKRLYTVDGVHLSRFGYIVVTKKLSKYIDD